MDTKLVKNQISYWESQLKEGERALKTLQEQNAIMKATIKNLKALLPKDKAEENADIVAEETL